jgi:protein O-GlcNAc transferase
MLGQLIRDWWQRRQAATGGAMALYRQGQALQDAQRLDKAAEHYRRALVLDPGFAEAHNNLGLIHQDMGRGGEAAQCFGSAIAANPALPQPYVNLGNLLQSQHELDGALANYDAALARDPGNWMAHNNRANLLLERGEHAAARAAFARAMALDPANPLAASNKLNWDAEALESAPEQLFQEYLAWGRNFAEPLARTGLAHTNSPDAERVLRLGYVSPDFRQHAMRHFIEPLLEHHDASAFELHCYSNVARPDAATARFKSMCAHWHEVAADSDAKLAQRISDDGIDLLVDLAGQTADNRLLVFARKPAPVQFTFQGHPNTTGVRAIDYRITDAETDPPGMTERYYVEQLLRLPDSLWCYQPAESASEIGPLPALANGYITFGSFNRMTKVTGAVIDTWARLLHRVPSSRLLMIAVASGETQRSVRAAFAAHGIDAARLILFPSVSLQDCMLLRNRVDIALDPYPINGGTTTCDSLWMGVPTVSLAGRVSAARAGASLLPQVGLAEMVAGDVDAYIETAATLAADLPRLRNIRAALREKMRASPLTDGARFVRNLESLYRQAWISWCEIQAKPAN